MRGLFSKGVAKGSRRQQMRCRLILLISEQGIRKGRVRHFVHGEDEDGQERTEWRILGSWIYLTKDLDEMRISHEES